MKGNLNTAKEIGELKLSGEDTKVILADHTELEGSGAGPLFEKVFYYDRTCPKPLNPISFSIITALLPDTHTIAMDSSVNNQGSGQDRTLSERTVIELISKAHNEIVKFCRNPKKTVKHVDELEKWVEVYYHANLMIFPVDKAFTGYKAKMLVLPKLLRRGNIYSLFDHLTEATENSNHGVNNVYHNHTMKDGGKEWHMTSEFHDLFHSFVKCVCLNRNNMQKQLKEKPDQAISNALTYMDDLLMKPVEHDGGVRQMVRMINQQPIPELKLDIGKTVSIFRGVRFFFILPKDDGKNSVYIV